MKKITLIGLIFIVGTVNAQMRGGGHQQQMQQKQGVLKFDAEKAAGIYVYDEEEIIKKLKVKDGLTQKSIRHAIAVYNKELDEVKFLNSEKLSELNEFVKLRREEAMSNNDREAMLDLKEDIREKLMPIKKKVNALEKTLSDNLLKVLSEKQYKKWLKYQAKMKEAQKPKATFQKQNRPPNNSRRGSGYGRRRNGF